MRTVLIRRKLVAMSVNLSKLQYDVTGPSFSQLPGKGSGLLDFLRVTHQLSRAKPKIDLIRACEFLKSQDEGALSAYIEALIRGLPSLLGRSVKFRDPGCDELSFDEAWLIRTFQSYISGDEASTKFLLSSRLNKRTQCHFRYLIEKISIAMR